MYVMKCTCMLWSWVQGMLCSGCSRANFNLIWEEGKQSRVLPKKNKDSYTSCKTPSQTNRGRNKLIRR